MIRRLHSEADAGRGAATPPPAGGRAVASSAGARDEPLSFGLRQPQLARVWLKLGSAGASDGWTLLEADERRRTVEALTEDALG